MKHFLPSGLITAIALLIAFLWAGVSGLFICVLMIILEVSFSFDNAVVNATVMRNMKKKWQQRFLTWGMLVTVFGMYYLFPLLIVSLATGLDIIDVMRLAIHAPRIYSQHVMASHTQIDAFGGMFLLMVFLTFILDEGKDLHWLGGIEKHLARLGQLEAIEIIVALVLLLALQSFLPDADRLHAMIAGIAGVTLYVVMGSIISLFNLKEMRKSAFAKSGLMGFIYLNLLDASFSLDAVVGSFVISNDIVIIVLGLSAGAMFVRSLTVQLVRKDTLAQYVFLEHGAHYAIGALAVIMLVSIITPVSQIVTGLAGLVFILASFWSSVRYNRRH
ncbi:MAG: DUF475 domain-containing protein [Pseudomonadota bacterium]|nr:DUF475 domain-containing protein [Pseudomonadota bacterium]MDE3037428.1 DUF475 domain-containing protein [Pseudomonadota bacterium]